MLKAHTGRPGHGGQGAGDARPLWPPRGARVLPMSATDDGDSFRFSRTLISLTARIDDDLTAKPWHQFVTDLNNFRRHKYQLQILFKELVLIRNRNGVKSPQISAVSQSRFMT